MEKEKVLVTGAAGFIGMHTVQVLVEKGFEVVGLDNFNDYYDVTLKYARLRQLGIDQDQLQTVTPSKTSGFSFVQLDLADQNGIMQLFQDSQFDYVINLAAQAGVRYSLEHPRAYVDSNISGFLNIHDGCRHHSVKHLVYASTSSVYGLSTAVPFQEESPTEHQVSFYAATKKANEAMAHSYSHLYQIPTTGLRFFTVYGPWGRPDMALFKFTKSILNGTPIDVYNHGNMHRDFTYVSDIAEGISRVLKLVPVGLPEVPHELKTNESTAPYSIYNIGNGKTVKLLDFVKALEHIIGKKAIINFMPLQPGDMYQTFASTENLEKAVDYRPKVGIKEGIDAFLKWYLDYYNH